MGIGTAMKDLIQDIASSREERMDWVKQVKEEAKYATDDARKLIKGFQASRAEAGAKLRKDLAQDKASRKSAVQAVLGDAQGLIKGFQTSRKEQGAQLRKELAQGSAERRSSVNTILGDAREAIKGFGSQRKQASSKLRKDLAQSQSNRKSEVGELLTSAQDILKDLSKSRQETGKQLRDDLAKARAETESSVKGMRSEFRRSQAELRIDINEARAAWQELRHQPEKAGVAEVPPVEEEVPDLEIKLLTAINDHPDGITLAKVAETLGVVPVVLGRASRRLLDEGKIRKEEKLYYPVAGE